MSDCRPPEGCSLYLASLGMLPGSFRHQEDSLFLFNSLPLDFPPLAGEHSALCVVRRVLVLIYVVLGSLSCGLSEWTTRSHGTPTQFALRKPYANPVNQLRPKTFCNFGGLKLDHRVVKIGCKQLCAVLGHKQGHRPSDRFVFQLPNTFLHFCPSPPLPKTCDSGEPSRERAGPRLN